MNKEGTTVTSVKPTGRHPIKVSPLAICVDPGKMSKVDPKEVTFTKERLLNGESIVKPLEVTFTHGRLELLSGYSQHHAAMELISEGYEVQEIPAVVVLLPPSSPPPEKPEKEPAAGKSAEQRHLKRPEGNMLKQGEQFLEWVDSGISRKDIADAAGKTEGHVSNCLKIARELPDSVKERIRKKEISSGIALTLLRKHGKARIEKAAEKVINRRQVSVRKKRTQYRYTTRPKKGHGNPKPAMT